MQGPFRHLFTLLDGKTTGPKTSEGLVGKLITAKKAFAMVDGKLVFVTLYRDSFSTDKEGNITRKFIASSPTMDIKITKVMMGLRVV